MSRETLRRLGRAASGPRLSRVLQGFSQAEIATAAGVDQATVSRFERGYNVSAESRQNIMKALGLGR